MPKNKAKTKTAIYHPPKKGMPYMVVRMRVVTLDLSKLPLLGTMSAKGH